MEKIEIVNGELKVTKSQDVVVTTMTKDEVIGKRAKAQTKVDHLQIDLRAAQEEVAKWNNYLGELNK